MTDPSRIRSFADAPTVMGGDPMTRIQIEAPPDGWPEGEITVRLETEPGYRWLGILGHALAAPAAFETAARIAFHVAYHAADIEMAPYGTARYVLHRVRLGGLAPHEKKPWEEP
jgi:hypothetical protein